MLRSIGKQSGKSVESVLSPGCNRLHRCSGHTEQSIVLARWCECAFTSSTRFLGYTQVCQPNSISSSPSSSSSSDNGDDLIPSNIAPRVNKQMCIEKAVQQTMNSNFG